MSDFAAVQDEAHLDSFFYWSSSGFESKGAKPLHYGACLCCECRSGMSTAAEPRTFR